MQSDTKRKRVSNSRDDDDSAEHTEDQAISIFTIDPSNCIDTKEKIERAKISKLLQLKKQKEEIDRQRLELDYLEKFILNKPITIVSEPYSATKSTTTSSQAELDDQIFSRQKAVISLLEEQGKHNMIRFNVRGKIFTTSRSTIEKRENMLKTMLSSNFGIDTDSSGAITLDCNPDYFQIILEHTRTGSTTHCGIWENRTEEYLDRFNGLLEEADFFGLSKLANTLKSIIKDIDSNRKQTSKTQVSLDSSMVTLDKEQKEQEYIENFMSLTITEKENADSYFSVVESSLEVDRQELLQREKELLSACSNPELVFNVRGIKQMISIQKIVSHPDCILNDLLVKVDSGELENNEILIDRDPDVYQHIFEFLKNGSFTIPNEEHKKKQIYREAKALNLTKMVDYFDPLRYPIETIGQDNIRMREEEDYIRQLFATDRENPILKDPHLFLLNIFENQSIRDGFKKENFRPSMPLIFDFEDQIECSELTSKGTLIEPPVPEIVNSKADFIAQFNAFTYGIFKDADFSNMAIAGGSVCACLLNHSDNQSNPKWMTTDWDMDDASEEEEESLAGNYFTDSEEDSPQQTTSIWGSNSVWTGFGSTTTTYNKSENQKLADKLQLSVWKESDIDIFLYGLTEQQAEEKLNYLFMLFKKNLNGHTANTYFNGNLIDDIMIVRTEHAITFYFSYPIRPIQIILRIYKSITEILCGFDIDSVCCAFDGSQVFALPRFKRALKFRMNMVDPDRQSTTYETRLVKYAKRGFRLAIPGYRPELIKNEYLTRGKQPFYYRRKHYYYHSVGCQKADVSQVTGLARILLYKQAHKFAKNVTKSIAEQNIETEALNHDYKQLCLPYSSRATPTQNYVTTQSVVQYFKEKLDKKPHFEYALNDLFSVLHTSGDDSTLDSEVKWLVIEPTTQKIGSFNPTTNNFYKDAYSSLNRQYEQPKKRVKAKAIYTWSWNNRNSYNDYDEGTCVLMEKSFREYRANPSKNTTTISATHYVDFGKMKQISLTDPSRQRAIKRRKSKVANF